MAATAEKLLDGALREYGAVRSGHDALLWLACQLRDNGYTQDAAAPVMHDFVGRGVYHTDGRPYTDQDADATLKDAFKKSARQPWHGADRGGGLSQRERLRIAAERDFGLDQAPTDPPDTSESTAKLRRQLPGISPLADTPAEAYLAGRGIPAELARAAKIRYHPQWWIPKKKAPVPAVVFPFYDLDGRLVAAHGRGIDDTAKDKVTYGPRGSGMVWTPGAQESRPIILVEGPMDALSIAACGYPAIARVATDFPDWFPKWTAGRLLYIAWDFDTVGEAKTKKLADACTRYGAKCIRLRPPQGKDFNEALMAIGQAALRDWLDSMLRGYTGSTSTLYCWHCGAPAERFNPEGEPYCERHYTE